MREYNVGDELRIREWNDMEAEFGRYDNHIPVGGGVCFTSRMKHLCGSNFTVSKIIERSGRIRYRSKEGTGQGWSIVAEMLEPRREEELYIATDSDLDELLYGGDTV